MAFVRFGEDGSDVYVIENTAGYYECCGCKVFHGSEMFDSMQALISHLRQHEGVGHKVPDSCYASLVRDEG